MIAQPLRSYNSNGLYRVLSGRYLLLKINSKQVKRYDLIGDTEYEKPLDISYYNHILVTEVPLISLINRVRKERRHDSTAHQIHQSILHSRILQGRLNDVPVRAGT